MSFSRPFVVVMAVVSSTAHADVLFVDNCTRSGDGTDGGSFVSIQAAIDAAADDDEVVVAPCSYFETINFLGKAISLCSSDGPNVTSIDAQGEGAVVTCTSGEGPDTVLEGFTLTGGAFSGGMLNSGSSPTVTNCSFTGNSGFNGGGMRNQSGSSPTVTDCTFDGNTANGGGGMYNTGNSSPTVTDCWFTGNMTDPIFGLGGGMANVSGSSPTVNDCTFTGNTTGLFGGGMANIGDSNAMVTGCTFTGNFSFNAGGGMVSGWGSPVVTDCTFTGNIALSGGGGMFNGSGSSPIVTNCILDGNIAVEGGGGMANLGTTPTVANCTFTGNSAGGPGGGAIFSDGFNTTVVLTVANSVLWDNNPNQIHEIGDNLETTVLYSGVQGGWPGTGNIDADPLFVDPGNGDYRLQPASPCIDAADNTAVPTDITTDLDGNPRFLDVPETPDTGNGTLPIVDMGAYESFGGGCLALISQEIVCHADGATFTVNVEGLNACTGGTTQVTFTGSGGSVGEELCFTALVNDGGFCCSTEICVTIPDCTPVGQPSDLDGDGIVGMVDFLALLGTWGSCSDCGTCPADFDGDCSVGILDLLILLGNWG